MYDTGVALALLRNLEAFHLQGVFAVSAQSRGSNPAFGSNGCRFYPGEGRPDLPRHGTEAVSLQGALSRHLKPCSMAWLCIAQDCRADPGPRGHPPAGCRPTRDVPAVRLTVITTQAYLHCGWRVHGRRLIAYSEPRDLRRLHPLAGSQLCS